MISALKSYDHYTRRLPELQPETWHAFVTAHQQSHLLSSDLTLTRNHAFISQKDVARLRGQPRPLHEAIEAVYPGAHAYMILSAIGYNPAAEQGLVYIAYTCGGECGTGELYLLSKKSGTWSVIGVVRLWTS